MRISDWSSDVCSSDLRPNISAFLPKGLLSRIITATELADTDEFGRQNVGALILCLVRRRTLQRLHPPHTFGYCRTMHKTFGNHNEQKRSEEHTSELQSLMRISYAVFCLQKTNTYTTIPINTHQHNSTHKYIN